MKIPNFKTCAAASALALALASPSLFAQGASPATSVASTPGAAASPAPSAADRMEQFRQRMNEHLKAELKATDEEWAVIQPLLEKVQTKMREANPRGFGFGGRGGNRPGGGPGGNPGGPGAGGPPPPDNRGGNRNGSPETEALRNALASDSSAPADIQTKLAALRAARKKSAGELEQARQDLVKVLTQRQEATLVLMGILE